MIPAAATVASVAPNASLHRFDAYRLALAFRAHVVRWLPLRRVELSDHLDRASASTTPSLRGGRRMASDEAISPSFQRARRAQGGPAAINLATTPLHAAAPLNASPFSICLISKPLPSKAYRHEPSWSA